MTPKPGGLHVSPEFRTRWLGYDRAQVDQFLEQTAADRQRLHEGLARLDELARQDPGGPTATLTLALREAQEIWATAEEQAHRLIQEAEDRAEFLQTEQLDAEARTTDWSVWLRRLLGQTVRSRPYALVALVPVCGFLLVGLVHWFDGPETAVASASVSGMRSMQDNTETPLAAVTDAGAGTVAPGGRSDDEQGTAALRQFDVPAEGLALMLTARRLCWIRTTVDDNEPVERLLQPNETILLQAEAEAVLRVGDAAALAVWINQRPARSFGGDGEVVTRRITRANYVSFLAGSPRTTAMSLVNEGSTAVFN